MGNHPDFSLSEPREANVDNRLGKSSSDMANGGGGSLQCANPQNIHQVSTRAYLYQGAVYAPDRYNPVEYTYVPRAQLPPYIPVDDRNGFTTPVGNSEYLFRIMYVTGMIPFGWRQESQNRDGNSWIWLDINTNQHNQANTRFYPHDRDAGNGAGREQTKE